MSSDADTSSSSPGEHATSGKDDQAKTQPIMEASPEVPEPERSAQETIRDYLLENVEEFRRLHELRRKGWETSRGDAHFKKQRTIADKCSAKSTQFFYTMMKTIAIDLDKATGALNMSKVDQPALLDMCVAPGGFVDVAMTMTPGIHIRAMSLPVEQGGHDVKMLDAQVNVEFRDITTLAADMGITKDDVPLNFPGPYDFLFEKVFDDIEKFDLVFCDGQVLRTHPRAEWREPREATRLTLTQAALGLEHLRNGGTMVILMHKLDSWRSFDLIHQFSRMATVKLYKHYRHHKIRSSFYLVAKNIQAESAFAKEMVAMWKQRYKIATFGTDEEYAEMHRVTRETVLVELEKFGEKHYATPHPEWVDFPNNLPPGTKPSLGMTRDHDPIIPQEGLDIYEINVPVRNNTPITLRIYRRTAQNNALPLFLYMHGGGYVTGGLETDDVTCRALALKIPVVLASVEYRLAPEHKFPVGFEDSFDIVRWAASSEGQIKLNTDLSRGFILGGTSAGANFTAGISHLARDEGLSPRITSVVFLAGSFCHPDVRPEKYLGRILSVDEINDAPGLTRKSIDYFAGLYGAPPTDKRLSPLLFDSHAGIAKKAYFAICGWDPRRDEAILLDQLLQEVGLSTRSHIYSGLPHGFWTSCPDLPVSKKWLQDLLQGVHWLLE
ncbi:AB hydrolase superfamily [Fusarium acutatum]|uniref:AB hydrolase superfamily n=1 Tax=Fusarium acutatum TaxID=78861 RepID=A0A8H4NIJ5_9HYPO|nr:AB hydrolase superfamily [Fusarium acutatum]